MSATANEDGVGPASPNSYSGSEDLGLADVLDHQNSGSSQENSPKPPRHLLLSNLEESDSGVYIQQGK